MRWYLAQVQIENFKCIQFADVPVYPGVTAVVGENGCGKSTFLEAIAFGLGAGNKHLRMANVTELRAEKRGGYAKVTKVSLTFQLSHEPGQLSTTNSLIVAVMVTDGKKAYQVNGSSACRFEFDEVIEKHLGFLSNSNSHLLWYSQQRFASDMMTASPEIVYRIVCDIAGTSHVIRMQKLAQESIQIAEANLASVSSIIRQLTSGVKRDEELMTKLQKWEKDQMNYSDNLQQLNESRKNIFAISLQKSADKILHACDSLKRMCSLAADLENSNPTLILQEIEATVVMMVDTEQYIENEVANQTEQLSLSNARRNRHQQKLQELMNLKCVAQSVRLKNETLRQSSAALKQKYSDDLIPHFLALQLLITNEFQFISRNSLLPFEERIDRGKRCIQQVISTVSKIESDIMNCTADAALFLNKFSDCSGRLDYLLQEQNVVQAAITAADQLIESVVEPEDLTACRGKLSVIKSDIESIEAQRSTFCQNYGIPYALLRSIVQGDLGFLLDTIKFKPDDIWATNDLAQIFIRKHCRDQQAVPFFSQALYCLFSPVLEVRLCNTSSSAIDILDQMKDTSGSGFNYNEVDSSFRLWPVDRITLEFSQRAIDRGELMRAIQSDFEGEIFDPLWVLDIDEANTLSIAVRKAVGNWVFVANDSIAAAILQDERSKSIPSFGCITLSGNRHSPGLLAVPVPNACEAENALSSTSLHGGCRANSFAVSLFQYQNFKLRLDSLKQDESDLERRLCLLQDIFAANNTRIENIYIRDKLADEIHCLKETLTKQSVLLNRTNAHIEDMKVVLELVETFKCSLDNWFYRLKSRDCPNSTFGLIEPPSSTCINQVLERCENIVLDLMHMNHDADQEIDLVSADLTFADAQLVQLSESYQGYELAQSTHSYSRGIERNQNRLKEIKAELECLNIRKQETMLQSQKYQLRLFEYQEKVSNNVKSLCRLNSEFRTLIEKNIDFLAPDIVVKARIDIGIPESLIGVANDSKSIDQLLLLSKQNIGLAETQCHYCFPNGLTDEVFVVVSATSSEIAQSISDYHQRNEESKDYIMIELDRLGTEMGDISSASQNWLLAKEPSSFHLSAQQLDHIQAKKFQLDHMLSGYDQASKSLDGLFSGTAAVDKLVTSVNEVVIQSIALRCTTVFSQLLGERFLGVEFIRLFEDENHDDIDSADSRRTVGLDLVVRTQHMLLPKTNLSVGQRASLAVSFLLSSALECKVPLYLFDEIDAALDEHCQQVLNAICASIFKHSQALFISHRTVDQFAQNIINVTIADSHCDISSRQL